MGERTGFFSAVISSSEMYCSLRYESIGGCPYHAFTHRGIAMLAAASSFLAIASLLIAA